MRRRVPVYVRVGGGSDVRVGHVKSRSQVSTLLHMVADELERLARKESKEEQ